MWIIWRLFIAALIVLTPRASFAQLEAIGGQQLEVTLQVPKGKTSAFKASEAITVDFVLTNPSASPVKVLAWRTPFLGVTDDIFAVAAGRAGQVSGTVGYIGPLIKRGEPQEDDFITLAPGESRIETVNLAEYYAIYQQNDYSVTYRPSLPNNTIPMTPRVSASPQSAPLRKVVVQSNSLTISVVEARQPVPKVAAAARVGSGLTFDACSANQVSQIQEAVPAARGLASAAAKLLNETAADRRSMAARYKTWFGAHSADRYTKIMTNFQKIEEAFSTKPIEMACNGAQCRGSVFAYVFPTQPYKIYVCQAFWNAALDGTDSRGGTLVHEMSHFDIVAGTDDVVYGQEQARALASSRPESAVENADSHEYFAENSPDLPM